RVVELLLNSKIGDSWHPAQLSQNLIGNCPVCLQITAIKLNVNWGGQTEIQNLTYDIGRQEIESYAGKASRKLAPQLPYKIRCRSVLLLERYQNIAFGLTDESRAVIGIVDRAVRYSDVVDDIVELRRGNLAANKALHVVAKASRLLDASTRFRPHMQKKLAVIGAGKEILSKPRDQCKCRYAEEEKNHRKPPAPVDNCC